MDLFVILTFFIAFVSSIFSGMSGGGGGFIIIPYFIAIGLSPANALATAKLGGIGVAIGSLTAFRGKGYVDKRYIKPFVIIMLVCALISAWLIPKIDSQLFEKIIGAALLLLTPTLFIKRAAFQPGPRSRTMIIWGFIAYTFFSFAQTALGSGIGTMIVLVLMFLFGMDALHASATKRVTQAVQAVVLFVLLALQGLVVWAHAGASLLGTVLGTHIGTHIAMKRGTNFVKYVLAGVMIVSGIALLL
jgi:uncharacterized protein